MFDFIKYMNTLATEHKKIAQTKDNEKMFRIATISDMEAVLQALNSIDGFFVMAQVDKNGQKGDFQGRDNFVNNPMYVFYIMKKHEFGDINALHNLFTDCETIGNDFLSRLIKDSKSDQAGITNNGLATFNRRTFTYYSVGPLGSFYRGIRYQFELTECANLVYNTSNWK